MTILDFLTNDGYRFRFDADTGAWSDGDLSFYDVDGLPMDEFGDALDGEFVPAE
jgi:hypothetical protein